MPAPALALASLGSGGEQGALDWIGQAIDERDANLISLVSAPCLEPLRATPAYQALLRRMNLA